MEPSSQAVATPIKLAFVAAMAFCAFGAWAGSGDICSYLEPVYNGTDGNPTNGIAYWETNEVSAYTEVASATGKVTWGVAGATSWYVVKGADVQIDGRQRASRREGLQGRHR